MFSLIVPFAIYYLFLFVISYVIVEYGQNYLYDEVTPGAGLKVALGALILAVTLTWTRSNFATMFTDHFIWTVLQAIVWFAVFVLVFRFQPWHGGGLALATMLIAAGTCTLVVDSMLTPRSTQRINTSKPANKPVRRPAYGNAAPDPKAAPEPAPAAK